MGETSAQRVLPSDELPRPRILYEHSPARTRREASATTVALPTIRRVKVGESDVLLTRLVGGEVVAFATNCPHQATPLEQASVFEGKLRCPRHQYLYDLRTGANIFPSRDARPGALWKLKPGFLPVYRVVEREGWIWIAERPEPPPPGYDPRKEKRPLRLTVAPRRKPPPPAEEPPADKPPTLGDPIALAGTASPPALEPETPIPTAGQSESQPLLLEPVEALEGEEFELVLPTRFVPACLWRLDFPGEGVTLLSQTFEPGAEPRYRLRLAARSPGEVTLRCTYARPWDATPKDARAFRICVRPRPGDPEVAHRSREAEAPAGAPRA